MKFLLKKGFLPAKTFLKILLMEVFLIKYNNIVLFEKLFNILYDEEVDCKLVKSPLLDVKI